MEGNVSLVTLIEYSDASAEVKAVYDDIMRTRGVDWVNNFWKARGGAQERHDRCHVHGASGGSRPGERNEPAGQRIARPGRPAVHFLSSFLPSGLMWKVRQVSASALTSMVQ